MPKTLASQFELTETQQKIFVILQDGCLHNRDEVLSCLREKYQTDEDGIKLYVTIQNHIKTIRKKIGPKGLQIDCVLRERSIHYRMSRNLSQSHKQASRG